MGTLPDYKDIIDLIRKGSTVEAQEKIVELREAAVDLKEENVSLREENRTLSERLKRNNEMEFNAPFYYQENDSQPFCPNCWENDKKAIHLVGCNDRFSCPQCDNNFFETEKIWARRKQFKQ